MAVFPLTKDYRGKICRTEVLKSTDQSGIDYRGADFCKNDLTRINLTGSDLRGALFVDTKLVRANLTKADLRGADLKGADLSYANTTSTDFRGAIYDDKTKFPQDFDLKLEGLEKEKISDEKLEEKVDADGSS